MTCKVAVRPADDRYYQQAQELAHNAGLDVVTNTSSLDVYDYLLQVAEDGLALHDLHHPRLLPIRVDFLSPALCYRLSQGSRRKEMLAKAMGRPINGQLPKVLDATAGMGHDGFVLASFGHKVTMIERHPIVFLLLDDGLKRAANNQKTAAIAANITLHFQNAFDYIKQDQEQHDVVYIDPMFPLAAKKAASKKEMTIFKSLVGQDDDAVALLRPALSYTKMRVVVKRPRLAPLLDNILPNFQLKGKACRLDVYKKS